MKWIRSEEPRIFIFPMYFCPSSYFLTKENIRLKFWEMIENILDHVRLVFSSFLFLKEKLFYTNKFFMLILQPSEKMIEAPYLSLMRIWWKMYKSNFLFKNRNFSGPDQRVLIYFLRSILWHLVTYVHIFDLRS